MTAQLATPQYIIEREAESVAKQFRINLDCSEKLDPIRGQNPASESYVVKEDQRFLPKKSYIVFNPEILKIGADLSVVRKYFLALNRRAARETAIRMIAQGDLNRPNVVTVILYQLRAAPVYGFGDVIRQLLPNDRIHEIFIRPKYKKVSFRDHEDKEVEIVYENFDEMPRGKRIEVIVPDSIATARTPLKAIPRFVEVAKKFGNNIEGMSYTGWISKVGAVKVHKMHLNELGVEESFYAWQLFTELARNGYDMFSCGLDESVWVEKKEKRPLGAATIIPFSVFLQDYVNSPLGVDKLGDYSERGEELMATRIDFEPAKTIEHLINSRRMTNNLIEASTGESWFHPTQQAIFRQRSNSLDGRLSSEQLRVLEQSLVGE